jgi:hypothetical protein
MLKYFSIEKCYRYLTYDNIMYALKDKDLLTFKNIRMMEPYVREEQNSNRKTKTFEARELIPAATLVDGIIASIDNNVDDIVSDYCEDLNPRL